MRILLHGATQAQQGQLGGLVVLIDVALEVHSGSTDKAGRALYLCVEPCFYQNNVFAADSLKPNMYCHSLLLLLTLLYGYFLVGLLRLL